MPILKFNYEKNHPKALKAQKDSSKVFSFINLILEDLKNNQIEILKA